ncbi:MAG: hypothetical protein Q7S87_12545 [Agitococcus sp.]|nr:hypothetical protein [Agitococcus sp.]
MKQISPNPSLLKRGTFFDLALILANKENAPPFRKGRLGGISGLVEKQISPNPSLTKRGTFFDLTYILAKEESSPPFIKGRLGGISAFLIMLVKGQQTLKVSPLVRLFDDYRIVSPLVTQLTQGRKQLRLCVGFTFTPHTHKIINNIPAMPLYDAQIGGFFLPEICHLSPVITQGRNP